jgi:hypothetical protein
MNVKFFKQNSRNLLICAASAFAIVAAYSFLKIYLIGSTLDLKSESFPMMAVNIKTMHQLTHLIIGGLAAGAASLAVRKIRAG